MARILYPRLFSPVSTTPETVTADRWIQQPTQPLFPPRRLSPAVDSSDGPVNSPAPVILSSVTVDRWLQPVSQPSFRRLLTSSTAISAPPYQQTTWNPLDKSSAIVLSNNNTTATSVGATAQAVRATTGKNAGRLYLEFTINTPATNLAVGIANASYGLATAGGAGSDANALGVYVVSPAQGEYVNGVALASGSAACTAGDVVQMCLDLTVSPPQVYISDAAMRTQGTPPIWNNSGTSNPNTLTQGLSLTGLAGGPYFPLVNDTTGGAVVTLNTTGPFAYAVPGNFAPYDGGPTTAGAEAVTADRWVQFPTQPLTPPRRLTSAVDASDGPTAPPSFTTAPIVTADRWIQPPTQPVPPRPRRLAAAADVSPPFGVASEIVLADKWIQPPSQPVPAAPRRLAAAADASPPFGVAGEIVLADKWIQPPTQPLIPLRRLTSAVDASDGPTPSPAPPVVASEIILADKWVQPFTQPVAARSRSVALQAGAVSPGLLVVPPPPPETVTLDKWSPPIAMLANRRGSPHAAQLSGPSFQPVITGGLGGVVTGVTAAALRPQIFWID